MGVALVSGSLWLFFCARVLGGVATSRASIMRAVIADVTPLAQRARYMGLTSAAVGGGIVMGSGFGALSFVATIQASTLFFAIGGLIVISAYALWVYLPETWKPITTLKKIKFWQCIHTVHMAYTHKKLRWWYGVFFAFSFSAGTFFYCIGPFLTVQRGFSQVMLSIFFASFGGALMVCQLVILPWISRRYAESGILMLALVGIALLYVGMLVPLHVSILMMLGMLYGAMYGLIAANTLGLLSKQTSPDQQGVVLGCATSVFMLGQLLPFIMASALAVPFGVGAPLVFATVLSCGLCVVYVCGFFEVGKGVASRLVPHQNGHPRASS